ncbi:hypothetical protein HDR62_00880 [bacterium]|nr:hypothetical protein [bacterium]
MIAPSQIRPPENWQDFELLCKKLWGEIWNCSDTIKRNGRNGQNQCGVDIYGAPNGGAEYYGIQCKGKDNYTQAQLTTKEIDIEIEKAKNFKPTLKAFYFATTAVKDAKIEEYIRKKNVENIGKGGFIIDIFSWEDIVDLLKERKSTYNWYINNCQYADNSDVNVSISLDDDNALHPKYFRITKKYKLRERNYTNGIWGPFMQPLSIQPISFFNPKCKVDYRWCDIYFEVSNIGSTTIEDYKIYIQIDNCQELSCNFHYCDSYLMDPVIKASINDKKDRDRELFETKWRNVLEFRPKQTKLLKNDFDDFKISVKPEDNIKEVVVQWQLLSRDYQKEGKLTIPVKPIIENKETIIYVDTPDKLKSDEEVIEPKIVEE